MRKHDIIALITKNGLIYELFIHDTNSGEDVVLTPDGTTTALQRGYIKNLAMGETGIVHSVSEDIREEFEDTLDANSVDYAIVNYMKFLPRFDIELLNLVRADNRLAIASIESIKRFEDGVYLNILFFGNCVPVILRETAMSIPKSAVHPVISLCNDNWGRVCIPLETIVMFCSKLGSFSIYVDYSVLSNVPLSTIHINMFHNLFVSYVELSTIQKVCMYLKQHNDKMSNAWRNENIRRYCEVYGFTLKDFYAGENDRLCKLLHCSSYELNNRITELML